MVVKSDKTIFVRKKWRPLCLSHTQNVIGHIKLSQVTFFKIGECSHTPFSSLRYSGVSSPSEEVAKA